LANRPQTPSEPKEVAPTKAAEVDVIVPPTELVLPMAAHSYAREEVMDMVHKAIIATKRGLGVRFA
jgi:hypothetical protein